MKAPDKETMKKYLQLQYWNQYLRQQGVISQREYLQMANLIRKRYSVT